MPKLYACTITKNVYILADHKPDVFDVEDCADQECESDLDIEEVNSNELGWDDDCLVYGDLRDPETGDNYTVKRALEIVSKK